MPILSSTASISSDPRRIVVAGTSGAGKTTFAGELGGAWGIEHIELDALHHGPSWQPRPEFLADVDALITRSVWITEWQYPAARPLLAEAADLFIWLDLPVRVTLWRVVRRTVHRRVRRVELWNGNFEPPLRAFVTDPDHIVRWAWRTRHLTRVRMHELAAARPELPIIRLTSSREVHSWFVLAAAQKRAQVSHVD